jgi:hypothetical protein
MLDSPRSPPAIATYTPSSHTFLGGCLVSELDEAYLGKALAEHVSLGTLALLGEKLQCRGAQRVLRAVSLIHFQPGQRRQVVEFRAPADFYTNF